MNILISVNDNFIKQVKTMLFSLCQNVGESMNVYHLSITISDEGKKDLRDFVEKRLGGYFISVDVEESFLKELPLNSDRFSVETYSRIVAQYVLPDNIERILWLDADMIVCKNIDEFYNIDFEGKAIVCAANLRQNSTYLIEHKKNLGMDPNDTYFNAGVILFNLAKLRTAITKDEIYECICNIKTELIYQDQDILNVLFKDDKKIVDHIKYNYQLNCERTIPKDLMDVIAILHYTGKAKPWVYRNIVESSLPYWNVVRQMGNLPQYLLVQGILLLKKIIMH